MQMISNCELQNPVSNSRHTWSGLASCRAAFSRATVRSTVCAGLIQSQSHSIIRGSTKRKNRFGTFLGHLERPESDSNGESGGDNNKLAAELTIDPRLLRHCCLCGYHYVLEFASAVTDVAAERVVVFAWTPDAWARR